MKHTSMSPLEWLRFQSARFDYEARNITATDAGRAMSSIIMADCFKECADHVESLERSIEKKEG